jgi:hypothetical protein
MIKPLVLLRQCKHVSALGLVRLENFLNPPPALIAELAEAEPVAPTVVMTAAHATHSGSAKQMFGDGQQIPHGEQNDEEADSHERVSTGERPCLVGKARAGCSVGQTALTSSPQHMEHDYVESSYACHRHDGFHCRLCC